MLRSLLRVNLNIDGAPITTSTHIHHHTHKHLVYLPRLYQMCGTKTQTSLENTVFNGIFGQPNQVSRSRGQWYHRHGRVKDRWRRRRCVSVVFRLDILQSVIEVFLLSGLTHCSKVALVFLSASPSLTLPFTPFVGFPGITTVSEYSSVFSSRPKRVFFRFLCFSLDFLCLFSSLRGS